MLKKQSLQIFNKHLFLFFHEDLPQRYKLQGDGMEKMTPQKVRRNIYFQFCQSNTVCSWENYLTFLGFGVFTFQIKVYIR